MEIKLFKKKKVFKEKNFKLSSTIYWRIILGLFFVLIIIGALFGYYTFVQINRDLVFPTAGSLNSGEKGKIEKVKDILDMFRKRAEKSNEILNMPTPVVDPSL